MNVFECIPLSARLAPEACASRHGANRYSSNTAKLNATTRAQSAHPTCAKCPMGAAHARCELPETWPDRPAHLVGRWSDGAPVVRVEALSAPRAAHAKPSVTIPVVEGPLARRQPPTAEERRKKERERKRVQRGEPTRRTERHEYEGKLMSVAQLAEVAGCTRAAMYRRLKVSSVADAVALGSTARGTGPAPTRHEYEGKMRTPRELAALAGTTLGAMRERLRRMSPAEAVGAGARIKTMPGRPSHRFDLDGESRTSRELAAMAGVCVETVRYRINRLGMSPREAVDAGKVAARARPKTLTQAVRVNVTPAQHAMLARLAKSSGMTVSGLLRGLVSTIERGEFVELSAGYAQRGGS